ncbi:MAG TPA: cell division protein ZipA C-terminal FtsZ-binding domain-containing protein [Burkholderiales bacterium]|nr:cell division protein ZipA C-terminal FtsZ-binding domain-containing protein [Burkholderiales bacterium]
MSELQTGLLGVGAVVIAGVYLFNLWQVREFRLKAERASAREHDAAVSARAAAERVEPQLRSAEARPPAPPRHAIDPVIDYVVEVTLLEPGDGAEPHEEVLALAAAVRKPALVAGRIDGGSWRDAGIGSGAEFSHLRFALQMINRAGCIDQDQLAAFRDMVIRWAARVGAEAAYGDVAGAHGMAVELDRFCTEVDVAISVNVVSMNGQPFHGAEIRRVAEAAGLRLGADGVFYCDGDRQSALFTVDNHEPMPFVPEQINTLQTGGVTFLLDVPRVSGGEQVFDRMLETARNFASALGGVVVDDKRRPLSDAAIGKIRAELQTILDKMNAAQIAAGSPRALRLFS